MVWHRNQWWGQKESSWLVWTHLPSGSGRTASSCTQIVCSGGRNGDRKRFPLPTVAFAQKHSSPGPPLTWGTTSKHCLPFQLCFSCRDGPRPPALSAGQGQSHRHIYLTQSPWMDPAPCLSWNQMPSLSLICGGLLFFLLFDSKYPGTCFLTSLCIHAENKQSLYKTPNISPQIMNHVVAWPVSQCFLQSVLFNTERNHRYECQLVCSSRKQYWEYKFQPSLSQKNNNNKKNPIKTRLALWSKRCLSVIVACKDQISIWFVLPLKTALSK